MKHNNPAQRQWLLVVLVGQEEQALVDTASDLNPIRKDLADHLCLSPFFSARAATQADSIPLKTYPDFHAWLQITDIFGAYLDAWDHLTSANIEVPFILSLPLLQNHNPIPNFDLMTIHCRDSSSTVTDTIEEPLNFGSLTKISTDFHVMQLQLETLDQSSKEPTIPKAYRDVAIVFLPFNANFLSLYWDEDHVIEL